MLQGLGCLKFTMEARDYLANVMAFETNHNEEEDEIIWDAVLADNYLSLSSLPLLQTQVQSEILSSISVYVNKLRNVS